MQSGCVYAVEPEDPVKSRRPEAHCRTWCENLVRKQPSALKAEERTGNLKEQEKTSKGNSKDRAPLKR